MISGIIKGFFIGIALVIPGLSASTFAVVMGLYDKIIFAVNNLRGQFKASFAFLAPIGLGAAVGILVSAGAIVRIMQAFPLQSYAFFIGLVIGSVPAIYGKLKTGTGKKINYTFAVVAFAAIAALSFVVPSDEVVAIPAIQNIGQFVTIFTAGLITCFLLAVPGISGSLILILLGQFGTVYDAVSNISDVAFMLIRGEEGAMALGLSSGFIMLAFASGAIIGLLAAAKIIGYLLERFEVKVYFAVMGLVLGAVVTLFNIGAAGYFSELNTAILINIAILAAFSALGFICTRIMSGNRR